MRHVALQFVVAVVDVCREDQDSGALPVDVWGVGWGSPGTADQHLSSGRWCEDVE